MREASDSDGSRPVSARPLFAGALRPGGWLRFPPDVMAVLTIIVSGAFTNGAVLPILGELRAEFGLSFVALGVVTSGFAFARAIFDLPGGTIADRFAARPIFYAAGALAVTGVALTFSAPSYPALVAGRLLSGGGSVIGSTAAMAYVARRTAPQDRGRAMGAVVAAAMMGGFLSPAVVGAVAAVAGWRAGVATIAAPAALSLVLVSLTVREPGPGARAPRSRRAVLQNPVFMPRRLVGVALLSIVIAVGIFGMKSTMLPLYGSEKLGVGPAVVGLAISLGAAIGFPVAILAGALSDRIGRVAVFVPGALVLAAMSVALNFTADAIAYVGVALVFAVDGGVSAMIQAMVVDRAGPERLGAALATNAFVRDLFIGAVPLILGAIIQTAGFWGAGGFLAGAAVIAALLGWRLGDTSPRARSGPVGLAPNTAPPEA